MHHPGVLPLLPREANAGQAEDGLVFAAEEEGGEDPAVLGEIPVRTPEASVRWLVGERKR